MRTLAKLALAAAALAAFGCKDDRPPRPEQHEANDPPRSALDQVVDASGLGLVPADPMPVAGNVKTEADAFTTLPACVEAHGHFDALIGDAVRSIGYDTFVLDVCRTLEALKTRDLAKCAPIAATNLRKLCERQVAVLTQDPNKCPLEQERVRSSGHDVTCLALAARDARLCAAQPGRERAVCEAIAFHEVARCEPLDADNRADCKRLVDRQGDLAGKLAVTAMPLAKTVATLVFGEERAPGETDLDAASSKANGGARSLDVSESFSAGGFLYRDRGRVFLDLGHFELEPSTHLMARSGNAVRVALQLALQLPALDHPTVERLEVVQPGQDSISVPSLRANLKVTLGPLPQTRGGVLDVQIKGTIQNAPLDLSVKTFLRDTLLESPIH